MMLKTTYLSYILTYLTYFTTYLTQPKSTKFKTTQFSLTKLSSTQLSSIQRKLIITLNQISREKKVILTTFVCDTIRFTRAS